MFLYVGDYWVEFPESEYGGTWVVMAENEDQAVELLKEVDCWPDKNAENIREAVENAEVFQLDDNVYSNRTPRIVEHFFT